MYALIGENSEIQENVKIGLRYSEDCQKTEIGDGATIRRGTIIYADVKIGKNFTTGHNALVREKTKIGDNVLVGTNVVIEGNVEIGNQTKFETNSYVPTHTKIGERVFMGPGATLTNDRYPLRSRDRYEPEGPVLENDVTLGANSVVLPGVKVGEGSIIGAGSVVTKDVPPWSMVKGNPARIEPLPEKLKEKNQP